MAGRDFSLLFNIGGRISRSFRDSFRDVRDNIENIEKKSKAAGKAMMAFSAIGVAGLTVAVNEAIKFESAFADVKKVVDGTPEELKAISDAALEMSTRLPMAATEITKIMAAGGQSGIAKNELNQFTEDAIKMGIAFDTTADDAGQSMAELRTAFRMNQKEVVTLADKINYLGNTTPATAKGIMEIVQRIGPLGEVGGFAAGSIAALGATIRGMGVQEEIAATGIKNMMLAMVAGEAATKSQKAAYKSLGLNSTDVAKGMQKDAEGTTLNVLKQISKLDKYKQAATLKSLFGSESLGAIAPLLTNMSALEKNLKSVGDATVYAGSMEKEYAARAGTTENAIKLAKNQINVLAITIGTTLLPTINDLLKSFGDIIEKVYAWTKKNPELTATITKISTAAFLAIGAIGAFSVGIWALTGPIMMIAGLFMKLWTVIKFLFGIVRIIFYFGRLLTMITPVGAAITALIAVGYLLYKNWATIGPLLASLWEGIKSTVSNAWVAIKGFFSSGLANITAAIINFSPIGLFYQAFAAVMNYFGFEMPSKFTEFGKNIIQGLINGISSMASAAVEKAKAIASEIAGAVKGFFGINSPSRLFMEFGEFNMMGLANGMTSESASTAIAAQSAMKGVIPASIASSGQTSRSMPSVSPQQASQGLQGVSNSTQLHVTQHITVGSQDAAAGAKEGAMSGLKEFESQFNAMMRKQQRVAY